jgi:hypothetical protein
VKYPIKLLVLYMDSAMAASCALLAVSPRCMTYRIGARICMNLHKKRGVYTAGFCVGSRENTHRGNIIYICNRAWMQLIRSQSPARRLMHIAIQHAAGSNKRSNAVGHGGDSIFIDLSCTCGCLVIAPESREPICISQQLTG